MMDYAFMQLMDFNRCNYIEFFSFHFNLKVYYANLKLFLFPNLNFLNIMPLCK